MIISNKKKDKWSKFISYPNRVSKSKCIHIYSICTDHIYQCCVGWLGLSPSAGPQSLQTPPRAPPPSPCPAHLSVCQSPVGILCYHLSHRPSGVEKLSRQIVQCCSHWRLCYLSCLSFLLTWSKSKDAKLISEFFKYMNQQINKTSKIYFKYTCKKIMWCISMAYMNWNLNSTYHCGISIKVCIKLPIHFLY